MSPLADADRTMLAELAPLLRRVADLEPHGVARVRLGGGAATALARLPFDVLVSRTVDVPPRSPAVDVTVGAAETVAWLDGERDRPPDNRDADWRGGTPPSHGWRRVDHVPDHVIRPLVRSGALALRDAAAREGVPGAQPRAEVADALLDSVVLTVSDDADTTVDLTLRTLSALTRMGFLPRGGTAAVDVAGRWTRVAAGYGTVLAERPGGGLGLL